MAKEFSSLPSDLAGIEAGPKSFYFNRAVYRYCSRIESEMDSAESAAKSPAQKRSARIVAFNRYMNPGDIHKGAFRDPSKKAEKKNWYG